MTSKEEFWRESFEAKHREYKVLLDSYKEFQESSQEFESELEAELEHISSELETNRLKLTRTESMLKKLRDDTERTREQHSEEVSLLRKKLEGTGDSNDHFLEIQQSFERERTKWDEERR